MLPECRAPTPTVAFCRWGQLGSTMIFTRESLLALRDSVGVLWDPRCVQYVLSTQTPFVLFRSKWTAQRVENPYLTHSHAATFSHLGPFWNNDSHNYYFYVIAIFTQCESSWFISCYEEVCAEHNVIVRWILLSLLSLWGTDAMIQFLSSFLAVMKLNDGLCLSGWSV